MYNFGAGPACLPPEVLQRIKEDIPNWYDGMSIMELSHRLPIVVSLTEKIEKNFRMLLAIPDNFAVLFMQGGARTQFSALLMNLLGNAKTADYVVTGHWSKEAFKDASRYCQAHCAASSETSGFTQIPEVATWMLSEDSPFLHYTDNETIHGIEFPSVPAVAKPLISDMTSNIASRAIDFSKFDCIYASAQKNLGIAGITVVIVRHESLGKAHPFTPPTLNYQVALQSCSMMNTPPVFCWYVLGLMVDWMLEKGGVPYFELERLKKSTLLYEQIDKSDFYTNAVHATCRSTINIPFSLPTPELDILFIEQANQAGFKQLKGHKVVGGCRASLYNALPFAGVKALVEFMAHFEKTHG